MSLQQYTIISLTEPYHENICSNSITSQTNKNNKKRAETVSFWDDSLEGKNTVALCFFSDN